MSDIESASDDDAQERDTKLLQSHVAQLAEHFDCVEIIVSRHEDERGSLMVHRGTGNWYTRYGLVNEWLVKADENTRITVRKDAEE